MKKGITPVIAIILLLLMAVAAAGALYFWFSRTQDDATATAQRGMDAQTEQASYIMRIDSIWNRSTQICLSVRNHGIESYTSTELSTTGIFVNDTLVDWDSSEVAPLPVGGSATICLCNGTVSGDCTAESLQYEYSVDSEGNYPSVPIRISPAVGSGDSRNFKYGG